VPTAISIRFLTGRAHLHPWDTHHSEGRVDWPPAPWRLLRALVAVAGRGLTALPMWDATPPPRPVPEAPFAGTLSKRGVPAGARDKLSFSKAKGRLTLREPLSDDEAAAWTRANPAAEFTAALAELRRREALPDPVAMPNVAEDAVPVSRLAALLGRLAEAPEIWLPRTSVGHTRHFFTIHESGVTRTTGSAVFDTFAVVDKAQPVVFLWPAVEIDEGQREDLRGLLKRLAYFGRAESWCATEYSPTPPAEAELGRTHWRAICWEDAAIDERVALGREHRDFTLDRRLAPLRSGSDEGGDSPVASEARRLLPQLAERRGTGGQGGSHHLTDVLTREPEGSLLLRCLLRESGADMKDGLDRPVGTRWVHYAVPREIFNLPARPSRRSSPLHEKVHVVRYVLNTATTQRPVLPSLTDALLVGEQLRRAVMARHGAPSENFSGKTASGELLEGHQHAFFLPEDEDLDGFIDHVTVWCRRAFSASEIRALRSLTNLRQRWGRPPLLVTPTRVAAADQCTDLPLFRESAIAESITPYVPPRHAFRARGALREDELPDRQLRRDILRRLEVVGDAGVAVKSITFQGEQIETSDGRHACRNGLIQFGEHRKPIRCLEFEQRRLKEGRAGERPHGQFGGSWRIEFSREVRGPLALGYACHYGLGQFRPVL